MNDNGLPGLQSWCPVCGQPWEAHTESCRALLEEEQ